MMDSATIVQPEKVAAGTTEDQSPIRIWKRPQKDYGTTAPANAAWKPHCQVLLVLLCCLISSSFALKMKPPTSSSNAWLTFLGGVPSTSPPCLHSVPLWCRNSPLNPKPEALESMRRPSLHVLWKRSQPRNSSSIDLESVETLCHNCTQSHPVFPSLTGLPAPWTSVMKASLRRKKEALDTFVRSLIYHENGRSKNVKMESPLALSMFENSPAEKEGDWHADVMGWVNNLFGEEDMLPSKSFTHDEEKIPSSDADILSPAKDVNTDILSPAKDVNADILSPAKDVNADILSPAKDVNADILSPAKDVNAKVWMDNFEPSHASLVKTMISPTTPNQPVFSEPMFTYVAATGKAHFGRTALGLNSGPPSLPLDLAQVGKDNTEALSMAPSASSKALLLNIPERLPGSLSTAEQPTTLNPFYKFGTEFSTTSRIRVTLPSTPGFIAITRTPHVRSPDFSSRGLYDELSTPKLRSNARVPGSQPWLVTDAMTLLTSGRSKELATLGSTKCSSHSPFDDEFFTGSRNSDKMSPTLGSSEATAVPFELVSALNQDLLPASKFNDGLLAALVASNEVNGIGQFWSSSASTAGSASMPSTLHLTTDAQTSVNDSGSDPLRTQPSELRMKAGVTEADQEDIFLSALPISPSTNQLYDASGGDTVERSERVTRFVTQLSPAATVPSIGLNAVGNQLNPVTGILSTPYLNQNQFSWSLFDLSRSSTMVNPITPLTKRTVPATNNFFNLAKSTSPLGKQCPNVTVPHLGSTSLLPNITSEDGTMLQVLIRTEDRKLNPGTRSTSTVTKTTEETQPPHTSVMKWELYPLVTATSGSTVSVAGQNPAATTLGTPVSASSVRSLAQVGNLYDTFMLSNDIQNVSRPPLHSANVSNVQQDMEEIPPKSVQQIHVFTPGLAIFSNGKHRFTSALAAATYDSYITTNSMGHRLAERPSPSIPKLSNFGHTDSSQSIMGSDWYLNPISPSAKTELNLQPLVSVTPVSPQQITESAASPIVQLSDLQVGAATLKSNRAKRTLPTEYLSLLSSESSDLKTVLPSSCETCISSNPVSSRSSTLAINEDPMSSSAPPISITRPDSSDFPSTGWIASLYGVGHVGRPVTNVSSQRVTVSAAGTSLYTTSSSSRTPADEQSVLYAKADLSENIFDNFTVMAFYDSINVKLTRAVKSPYPTASVEGKMGLVKGKDQLSQGATISLTSAGPILSSFTEDETPKLLNGTPIPSVTGTTSCSIGQSKVIRQHRSLLSWISNATSSLVAATTAGHTPDLTLIALPTNLALIETEPKPYSESKPSATSASIGRANIPTNVSTGGKSVLHTAPSVSGTSIPSSASFGQFLSSSAVLYEYPALMKSESSVPPSSPQPDHTYTSSSMNISSETVAAVSNNSTSFTVITLGLFQKGVEGKRERNMSAQSSEKEVYETRSQKSSSPFTTHVKSRFVSDYWTDATQSTPVLSPGMTRFKKVNDDATNLNIISHDFPSYQPGTRSIASSITRSTRAPTRFPSTEVMSRFISLESIFPRITSNSFTGLQKRAPQSTTFLALHGNPATVKDSTDNQWKAPSWPTVGTSLHSIAAIKDTTGFGQNTSSSEMSSQSSKTEVHWSPDPMTSSPFTTRVMSGFASDFWAGVTPPTPVISTGMAKSEEVTDNTTNLNYMNGILPDFPSFDHLGTASIASTDIHPQTPSWPTVGAALHSTAAFKDSAGFGKKTSSSEMTPQSRKTEVHGSHSPMDSSHFTTHVQSGFASDYWADVTPSTPALSTGMARFEEVTDNTTNLDDLNILYDFPSNNQLGTSIASSMTRSTRAPTRSPSTKVMSTFISLASVFHRTTSNAYTDFQKKAPPSPTVKTLCDNPATAKDSTDIQAKTPSWPTVGPGLHSTAAIKDSTGFRQNMSKETTGFYKTVTSLHSAATANDSVGFQWAKSPSTTAVMTSNYSTMSQRSTVMGTQRKHREVSTIHSSDHIFTTSLFHQTNSTVVQMSPSRDSVSASRKPTGSTKRHFNTVGNSTSHAGLKQSTKETLSHEEKTTTSPVKTSSAPPSSSLKVKSPRSTVSTSISSTSDSTLTQQAFTSEMFNTKVSSTREMDHLFNETNSTLLGQFPESDDPLASLYTEVNPATGKSTPVPSTPVPSTALPLQCRLTGIQYTPDLQNQLSKPYKTLAREVQLTMNKMFSAQYGSNYFGTRIVEFKNGSVIVRVQVLFRRNVPHPSGSDLVRTVVSEVYRNSYDYFVWKIDPPAVRASGYSLQNLEPERVSVSFIILGMGFAATLRHADSPLEAIRNQVIQILRPMFSVQQFLFVEVRNIRGDLAVKGDLYLKTEIHADARQILEDLKSLLNRSVDLSSLSVSGVRLDLKIYPIRFRITNRSLTLQLMDHSSKEFQQLAKDLVAALLDVLKDAAPLQVVVRDVLSGSLLCRGDLIYQSQAPPSQEVLQTLIRSISSSKVLGSSAFQVDPASFSVADAKPDVHFVYPDFPGFAVAIIVMCGLAIIAIPFLILLFLKTGVFSHRRKAVIQERQDPEVGLHNFELDNRGFLATVE